MCLSSSRYFFLCSVFTLFNMKETNSNPYFNNQNMFSHQMFNLDAVLLPCPSEAMDRVYWRIGKRVLNVGTYIIGNRPKNNIQVFENTSLLFKMVYVSDEGLYYCGNNSTIIAIHSLHVNVER